MVLQQKGRIIEWNQNKGFGFILSNINSSKIFIHISDFKYKQCKPKVGDIVIYEVGKDKNNRKKAINVLCRESFILNKNDKKVEKTNKKFYLILPLLLLLMIFLSKKGNDEITSLDSNLNNYSEITTNIDNMDSNVTTSDIVKESNTEDELNKLVAEFRKNNVTLKHQQYKEHQKHSKYTCDGRQYCSQMHSCAEAKFFITHCPNTKMDGDRDGIPCERQWCY